MSNNYNVTERFMRYVQIDTTADPNSKSFPSSAKQRDLAEVLYNELKAMGLQDVLLDEWSYVFATIPSNVQHPLPTICFCSHMDTAPDCSGTNVKPILHTNYQGQDLTLPDDPTQVLSPKQHPYLLQKIGDDLITASGLTLLGADDKAGVAIIMELAAFLQANPQIPHGPIRILFTPDEEVGRGVEHLDMQKLNADFGYTLDGGPLGDIEDETFSADAATLTFNGISAHPGYAKGKMINAIKLAAAFVSKLPSTYLSPESTKGREGFVHPTSIDGGLEQATVQLIIRDHDTQLLTEYAKLLTQIAKEVVDLHPGSSFELQIHEQYRNMKEILVEYPFVSDYAEQAMKRAGLTPQRNIIRGGTDGSRLSFMGLPCPNIFTGEMAIHSKLEYVSVQDMEKAIDTLVELVQIWEKHTWNQA
ncbi:MAG: peptidase T [Flavobacteriales bacterium]